MSEQSLISVRAQNLHLLSPCCRNKGGINLPESQQGARKPAPCQSPAQKVHRCFLWMSRKNIWAAQAATSQPELRIMCCLDGGAQSTSSRPTWEKGTTAGEETKLKSSCFLQTRLNYFLHFTNLLHSDAHFFIFSRRAGKIKRFHVFPDTKHFSLSFNSRLSIQQLGMSLFGEGWTSKAVTSEETAEPESSTK